MKAVEQCFHVEMFVFDFLMLLKWDFCFVFSFLLILHLEAFGMGLRNESKFHK